MTILILLLALFATSDAVADSNACTHRYRRAADIPHPQLIEWQYLIGATLVGRARLDLDGDSAPDDLSILSEVQREFAVNPDTGERSGPFCWFNTRLEIKAADKQPIYSERWSIRFEDLGELLETHGVLSPEAYFRGFFSHSAYFTNGISLEKPTDLEFRSSTIKSSLISQKIASDLAAVTAELRSLTGIRTLTYRASWREDLRIVAYVPSQKRGVRIQAGY